MSKLDGYGLVHAIRSDRDYAELPANGHEALTCVQKARYDVILMDCHMPEGVARLEDRLLILLDLDRVLTTDEQEQLLAVEQDEKA